MTLFIRSLSLFFIFYLLTGCIPKAQPDHEDDYSILEFQERKLLNETLRELTQMQSLDAALYLNENDFNLFMSQSFSAFSQHFTALNAPSFSKVSLGRLKIALSKGQIRSRVDFSFEVDALGREIFGHLLAKHEVKAGKDEFIISTDFDEIVLDHINDEKDINNDNENKIRISAAVKSFLHTLNIEIINVPLSIKVNMNILNGVNGKDVVNSQDYKLHSASAINMQTKMLSYATYVNDKGVVLLGSSKLKNKYDYQKYDHLEKLRDLVKTKINTSLMDNIGIDLEVLQRYSSYYMSKSYISQQMNRSLKYTDLRTINKFFLKIPKKESHFVKELNFFDKSQLPSCEGIAVDCSKKLISCNGYCTKKFGVHNCKTCTNITNPFAKVRCVSEFEACKSKEELLLYECNKREDRCDIEYEEIKNACEVDNLERVSICKEDKEKLEFKNNEIALARLKLEYKIANSYAVQRIRRIVFDKDLSRLEIYRDMHISFDSKLSLETENNKMKDINCTLMSKVPLLTHSEKDYVNQSRNLAVFSQRSKDGKIFIKAISRPRFESIQMNNYAYKDFTENKEYALQCFYKEMPMKKISSVELLKQKDIPYALNSMLGQLELKFEDEELSFVILPVRINEEVLFYPTMENKSIGFSRQAHFY